MNLNLKHAMFLWTNLFLIIYQEPPVEAVGDMKPHQPLRQGECQMRAESGAPGGLGGDLETQKVPTLSAFIDICFDKS